MKGVVFLGDCELALEDFPDPTPGPGEVVLAMKASGMCGSDLHAYRAPKGRRFSIGRAGQGPVGLSATQLAAAMGARVIALDVGPERLARAKEFGAAEGVNPQADDAVAAIKALTQGRGADLTLDTSGAPSARASAVRATKTWGTCCFVGERDSVTLVVSADMLRRQLTLIASWT